MSELEKLIDDAEWKKSPDGDWLDLHVRDAKGRPIHVWMNKRPYYCDRGHVIVDLEGIADIDAADRFPRYFFSFPEADRHVRAFLKWRLLRLHTVDVEWPE